jgi:hypothetical protein
MPGLRNIRIMIITQANRVVAGDILDGLFKDFLTIETG